MVKAGPESWPVLVIINQVADVITPINGRSLGSRRSLSQGLSPSLNYRRQKIISFYMIVLLLRRINYTKVSPVNLLRKMHAIRVHQFGGPEVLKYQAVTLPSIEPTQVLVKVKAIGVNPVETYIRSGAYAKKPELPFTPGELLVYCCCNPIPYLLSWN